MRILCGLLLLSLACRSSTPEPGPAARPPVTADAAAVAPATPAAPAETAATRRARADAALARIPAIKESLAKIRGLAFKQDVPAEYQEAKDFRLFVQKEIARELPTARAEAMATAWAHIGLLEKLIDLPRTLEDALVSQAGAYYDPAQKKYFLVMVPTSDMALDTITAHELTHALQDQHYDIVRYYPHRPDGTPAVDEDAMNARRFIVEGDATLAMLVYMAASMAKLDPLDPKIVPALEMQLGALANMSIDQLKDMSKQNASSFVDMGEEMKAALAAMDTIPLVLLVPLLESYTKGALPVFQAFKHGRWAEVARLYADPPDSTEQVLHPAEKLYPKRDLPKKVALPTPAGYELVHGDTMGELEWRVYFMLWNKAASEAAAAGWDGDRYAVVRGKDGKLAGLIATTWDSPADAEEFETAYKASLVKRFGGDGSKRTDGAPVEIARKGNDVLIVDGASDPKLMAALQRIKIR